MAYSSGGPVMESTFPIVKVEYAKTNRYPLGNVMPSTMFIILRIFCIMCILLRVVLVFSSQSEFFFLHLIFSLYLFFTIFPALFMFYMLFMSSFRGKCSRCKEIIPQKQIKFGLHGGWYHQPCLFVGKIVFGVRYSQLMSFRILVTKD